MCDNAHMNHARLYGGHVSPQCYNNEATQQLTITYNAVESDTLKLCAECVKIVKRDAMRHRYKVKTRNL